LYMQDAELINLDCLFTDQVLMQFFCTTWELAFRGK
jgi:hypothetical protein